MVAPPCYAFAEFLSLNFPSIFYTFVLFWPASTALSACVACGRLLHMSHVYYVCPYCAHQWAVQKWMNWSRGRLHGEYRLTYLYTGPRNLRRGSRSLITERTLLNGYTCACQPDITMSALRIVRLPSAGGRRVHSPPRRVVWRHKAAWCAAVNAGLRWTLVQLTASASSVAVVKHCRVSQSTGRYRSTCTGRWSYWNDAGLVREWRDARLVCGARYRHLAVVRSTAVLVLHNIPAALTDINQGLQQCSLS